MMDEPWKQAELLWDKRDPEVRAVLSAAIAANPDARRQIDEWVAEKDEAWRAMFAAPSLAAIESVIRFYPSEQRGDAVLYF